MLGNRQQLVWDLPPEETFLLNRAIYDIAEGAYRERLGERVDVQLGMLDVDGERERLAQRHLGPVQLGAEGERLRGGGSEEQRDHLRFPRARKSAASGAT